MSKKKKDNIEIDVIEKMKKEIEIKSASLKDDFCNYSYELRTGVMIGDELSRNGASVVHEDLRKKFARLAVHIAFCDGSYGLAKIDVQDIDSHHDDDIASTYDATGFKINGSGDSASVVLIGTKGVRGGRLIMKMPEIDFNGSYPFINELRVAIDDCIEEVEAYMHGKTAPKMVQSEMFDDEDDSNKTE
jgi:hypothetical protein